MNRTNISNTDNIIDSRDVIARIEELEAELLNEDGEIDTANEDPEYRDSCGELASLQSLASEGEGSPDWAHGETLIRDSYFRDYAEQLADDIGAIDRNLSWPLNCIDWDQAARELRMDYTAVDFDGVTYWIR